MRLDLKTGFLCNNNCLFCVQADNKPEGNRTIADIKKDLDESRERCDEVVLTGGEVTMRKDIFEIISYAHDLGYKTIQIQSNCRAIARKEFLKKLIRCGANEFAPSLHGHIARAHDFLTQSPGSFYQTVIAIKNIREEGMPILSNTVVVKQNYKEIPNIVRLLLSLGVDQYQLAFVHPMGNAMANFEKIVPKITDASFYIKEGLKIGKENGIKCMAEAMPYCTMEGYEEFVSERCIPCTEVRAGIFMDKDHAKTRRDSGKVKFGKCKICRYFSECEGPWKEYPQAYGDEEFQPVKT